MSERKRVLMYALEVHYKVLSNENLFHVQQIVIVFKFCFFFYSFYSSYLLVVFCFTTTTATTPKAMLLIFRNYNTRENQWGKKKFDVAVV